MRYYVVSDVHSFYNELITALTEKGFFDDKEPHKLIVCGDLFDRGTGSKALQQFILDLMEKDEVILIKGNHEDLFLELTRNAYKWFCTSIRYTAHGSNGTVDTVLQLTDTTEADFEDCCKMKELLQATPYYKKIIPSMVDYFETKHYIFVHGWIPCWASGYGGVAQSYNYMADWREGAVMEWDFARWYNGIEAWRQGVREANKTIVCGHWNASYGHCKIEKK